MFAFDLLPCRLIHSSVPPPPVGTPLYDRLHSHRSMPVRPLPTPGVDSAERVSPASYPRPLPRLPPRSQSQLSLPLEPQARRSRSASPAARPPTAPNVPSTPASFLTSASASSPSSSPASLTTPRRTPSPAVGTPSTSEPTLAAADSPRTGSRDLDPGLPPPPPPRQPTSSPRTSPRILPISPSASSATATSPQLLTPGPSPVFRITPSSPQHVLNAPSSPESSTGFAARFGKKKRQLSRDLLRRREASCEDLLTPDGARIQMIPQHHIQTMAGQVRYPELSQDRNWSALPPPPPSPRGPKLNLGLFSSRARKESNQSKRQSAGRDTKPLPKLGVLARVSTMSNSPSIAAAIEYMQEHDGRTSESDVSSVASLLSSTGTGTGTSASEVAGTSSSACYDADASTFNTPHTSSDDQDPDPDARPLFPRPGTVHDPDKRVSTASSQRTLMAWNQSSGAGGFVFPTSEPLGRVRTSDGDEPVARPGARLGQLTGSLKRRSASMSVLIPPPTRTAEPKITPALPPRPQPLPIAPPEGPVTDSEGYLSSVSNPTTSNPKRGLKGRIAAWTTGTDSAVRRKHPRTGGSTSLAQLDLSHHHHQHIPLMSIAGARDLALGVGKRVEKFYRARSASGVGLVESRPMSRGTGSAQGITGARVPSPASGTVAGLEPVLPPPLRTGVSGSSVVFGRSLDDPGVPLDLDGWTDEEGVKRCVGLPAIVSRCVRYLEKWGGDEEGLFRISGRPSHVARLRAEFDSGADYELSEVQPSDLDPHAVSSLFKAYLRENPILTRGLKHRFDLAMSSTSNTSSFDLTKLPTSMTSFGDASSENMRPFDDALVADVKSLVDQLPQINYVLLHEICHLLRFTSDRAKTTKMPLGNLLLLFCPTLGFSAGFLRCLVEGQDRLFEWGRRAPIIPKTQIRHVPSASVAQPSSMRSLKSPLSVQTDLVPPRTRAHTSGSTPSSRASMFFPIPRRPSITMLFGTNRKSQDVVPRQSMSSSESEEDGGVWMKSGPPRVSLDIPDGRFSPLSKSPPTSLGKAEATVAASSVTAVPTIARPE